MELVFCPLANHVLWTCTDSWRRLPLPIWSLICRLTGAEPPTRPTDRTMDPIDIAHLWKQYKRRSNEKIYWILVDMQELVAFGFRPPTQNTRSNEVDTQLFLSIDPTTTHFQRIQNTEVGNLRIQTDAELMHVANWIRPWM